MATPAAPITEAPVAAAPAAAPSTPSTPATPATSVPASFETPAMNPGESEMGYLGRVRGEREKFDSAHPENPAEAPAPPPAVAAPAEPAKDKPLDGEVGTEAAKPAEGEEDPLQALVDDTLSEKGPLPPRELAQKLRANPALEAELQKDPELYHSVMAASRLAAQVSEYKEIFPDVDSARFAFENATQFGDFRELFADAVDAPSTGKVIGKLIELGYERDEQGNLKLDANQQPISDGSAGRFIDNINRMALDHYIDEATKSEDDELLAAANVLKARMEGGSATQDEELTEQMKQQRAELDAREQNLHRAEGERLQAQHTSFEKAIGDDVEKQVADLVKGVVGRTNITDFNKKAAIGEITSKLYAAIKNDKMFVQQRDSYMRRGYSDEVKQKRIALAVGKAKAVISRIAGPVLRDAGATFVANQKTVSEKVAAQVATSRTEPKGGTQAAPAPQAKSPAQMNTDIRAEFQQKHGRAPSEQEFLSEWQKRS